MTASPPVGLPVLGAGSHRHPDQGACLMEYVSVLAGENFSDRPTCTLPALRMLAHRVNDATSDAGRSRLALTAPELVGLSGDRRARRTASTAVLLCSTAAGLARAPHDAFLLRLHRRALDRYRRDRPTASRYALEMALQSLRTHLAELPEAERDWYLHDLLARAAAECRLVLDAGDPSELSHDVTASA